MTLVIDASIVLSWYFKDEQTRETQAVLREVVERGAVVPGLWRIEVANSFRSAVRRRRASQDQRDAALANLAELAIDTDQHTSLHAWGATLALADRHDLTPYDASYLELAQRQRLPLATLDSALRMAAVREGVAMFVDTQRTI